MSRGHTITKTQQIVSLAKEIASTTPGFHKVKGPGKGDKANHAFMATLRSRVREVLGEDYAEKQICGDTKSAVDFFIPEEKTIIEIALSLAKPQSEFHKDIFKALLARDNGVGVEHLVFVAKPGARKRLQEPASQAIIHWLNKYYSISVTIEEME
jgi:hypothetical protein